MPDRPLDVVTGLLEFVGVAVLALSRGAVGFDELREVDPVAEHQRHDMPVRREPVGAQLEAPARRLPKFRGEPKRAFPLA